MSKVQQYRELVLIAEKFTKHLESLERMLAYSELIEQDYIAKKESNRSLGDIVDTVIHVKRVKVFNDRSSNMSEEEKLENEKLIANHETVLSESDIVKFIDKHLELELTDDLEISGINITSEFVNQVFEKNLNESDKMYSDINQLLNSIIISIVTGMELLIADLFKDFVQHVDQSDLIKNKQLTYSDLVKVGDIEEARILLIDGYIEELLKQSFKAWLDEIEKKMNVKVKSNSFMVKDIEKIFEVFQRRHLLIHNNGVVNSLYLTKVHPDLTVDLEKNHSLEIDDDYIKESINMFRRFGLALIYLYLEKKYKNEIDTTFAILNNLLITPGLNTCLGTRYIFKEISKNQKYSHHCRLLAEINFYLTYKLSDTFEEIRPEVEKFTVTALSTEFKMAKNILLDNFEDALEEFKVYCSSINDNEFINVIEWPLLKVARNSDIFVEYINSKVDSIIKIEEEENIET